MGRIVDGTTVSDYHASEKQRQISTQTSLLHAAWMDKKFNILDTPGYLDFMSEPLAASQPSFDQPNRLIMGDALSVPIEERRCDTWSTSSQIASLVVYSE